jgi:hypothetical protein
MSYTRRPASPFRDRYMEMAANMTYETRVRRLEAYDVMLAALRAVMDDLDTCAGEASLAKASPFESHELAPETVAEIRAAIAKAEGKETAK